MIMKRNQGHWVLSAMAVMLLATILACTSNDTLFIKLTTTPVPTLTSTPLSQQTRYNKGDKVYAVSSARMIELMDQPGEKNLSTMGNFAQCFRNTSVTITDTSLSVVDSGDKLLYYQIDCGPGGTGWVPEYFLTLLNPKGGKAEVKSPDGKGATLYKDPTTKSAPVGIPCTDGTQVSVSDVTRNVDFSSEEDTTLYAEIKCGDQTGYVLETLLVPTKP
jgi:hypothetical protein